MDTYWRNYEAALDQIRDAGDTVADVIRICNAYFDKSVADAFFPGGGDRDLMGTLDEHGGWDVYWAAADYHFKARDRSGRALEYCEGDIYGEGNIYDEGDIYGLEAVELAPANQDSSGDAAIHDLPPEAE